MTSILCSEKLAVCLLKAWLTARTPAHISHTERTECGLSEPNLFIGTVYSATDVAGWLSHCNFTCWSQKSPRCWVMHANVTKWDKMCVFMELLWIFAVIMTQAHTATYTITSGAIVSRM